MLQGLAYWQVHGLSTSEKQDMTSAFIETLRINEKDKVMMV